MEGAPKNRAPLGFTRVRIVEKWYLAKISLNDPSVDK
jgi:hypothetical protein